jgi:hypothetical protein
MSMRPSNEILRSRLDYAKVLEETTYSLGLIIRGEFHILSAFSVSLSTL